MCELARSRLIAWMDGECEVAEAEAVRTHAEACSECQGELRSLRALSRDITDLCVAAGGAQQRRRWWIPVGAAAAAAILLAAGLMWMRERPAPVVVSKSTVQVPAVVTPVAVAPARTEVTPTVKVVHHIRRQVVKPPKLVAAARGEPGYTVIIPLDEVLPLGAAPPGAVLVGNLAFDAGGQLSTIRLE